PSVPEHLSPEANQGHPSNREAVARHQADKIQYRLRARVPIAASGSPPSPRHHHPEDCPLRQSERGASTSSPLHFQLEKVCGAADARVVIADYLLGSECCLRLRQWN